MKILAAALSAILFCVGIARACTSTAAIDKADAATVIVFGNMSEIEVDDSVQIPSFAANTDYCSGVLIRNDVMYDVVVTAAHCVRQTLSDDGGMHDPQPVAVKFHDGRRYKVLWSAASREDDIGVLLVQKTGRRAIPFSSEDPVRGQDYFTFSMPNGYPWVYSPATSMNGTGRVSPSRPEWIHANLYACVGCGPGDSGGGLFDQDGDLMAITVGGHGALTIAIPSQIVIEAVADLVPTSGNP